MIVYNIKCNKNHIFEAWFRNSKAFEEQFKKHQIKCPVCGSSKIERLVSDGGLVSKREAKPGKKNQKKSYVKELTDFLEKNFEDVGSNFAKEALKIHNGEIEPKNVLGTATKEEEKDLVEEGVKFTKIQIPKFDS